MYVNFGLLLDYNPKSAYTQHILNNSHEENCTLLGYYVASCGNCLLTFRDNVLVPSSKIRIPRLLTFEDGTNKLSLNISKQLSHDAV
jgi:hypothetical protein